MRCSIFSLSLLITFIALSSLASAQIIKDPSKVDNYTQVCVKQSVVYTVAKFDHDSCNKSFSMKFKPHKSGKLKVIMGTTFLPENSTGTLQYRLGSCVTRLTFLDKEQVTVEIWNTGHPSKVKKIEHSVSRVINIWFGKRRQTVELLINDDVKEKLRVTCLPSNSSGVFEFELQVTGHPPQLKFMITDEIELFEGEVIETTEEPPTTIEAEPDTTTVEATSEPKTTSIWPRIEASKESEDGMAAWQIGLIIIGAILLLAIIVGIILIIVRCIKSKNREPETEVATAKDFDGQGGASSAAISSPMVGKSPGVFSSSPMVPTSSVRERSSVAPTSPFAKSPMPK